MRSAPLILHTARKGGSLTSSIGARRSGKSGSCIVSMVTKAKRLILQPARKGTIPRREHMQTYLKTRPVFVQLLLFIGMAMGIFMVVFWIGGSILAQITGIPLMDMGNYNTWNSGNPAVVTMLRGTFLLQFLGLFLVPSLLFGYFSDARPAHYLGLRKPGSRIYWALGITALLAAVPFVEWTGIINRWMVQQSPFTRSITEMEQSANRAILVVLEKRTIGNLVLNLIFIALFAGIGEELFFRGILQRLIIRSTRNAWAGILISAFLFSFFHFQFLGLLPRLFLGIILGALYWYSGSLWTAILAHFLYDALFIVIAYLYPATANSDASIFEGTRALLLMALGSAGLTIFLIWTMQRRSRTSFNETYEEELSPLPLNNDQSF
ncbi:MAG: CPBP family intramembrane metalloprotease [Chitinophagaceae bacterium]|nr:MAG: CPBP family intramembrane metalloprotease [Chitinophagaceae bacterium]